MKKYFIIILLIISCGNGYSQVLKGTILDKDTKKPIDYAVAYFAGTFNGTNADKNGNFELDISKNKSMPLTISAMGYYSVNITDLSDGKPLVVDLAPKVFELNEFVVGPGNIKKAKREREKNLKLFRKQFLGETPNARFCKILNENDITLRYESDTLKAFASKPIIIDNLALGYKITFSLDNFAYVAGDLLMYLKGNIFFNSDLNNSKADRFERKRRTAYLGSRMQFFRALWDNKLDSAGFTVTDSTNSKLLSGSIIAQCDSQFTRKYFKYRGELHVKYGDENRMNTVATLMATYRTSEIDSRLAILGDSVYFDRNGASVEGIRWYGRMGIQRIADTLPFEYYPNEDTAEDSIQPKNQVSSGDSLQQSMYTNSESQKLNTSLPGEKVYLHLDRPNYMQGDTIWFKAYSWYGYDQLPDTVSKVLYVDLLNPKDSVELKRKLLIQNGTSVGEFSLDKNIPPGKYTVRAYTRWMQNENVGEPFYQALAISSLNQNFQVDCSPLIIKQTDGDSLRVTFRFYEIDPAGELKNDFNHSVNYSIKIGDKVLKKDQTLVANAKEQIFKSRLPAIGENDSMAVLQISIKDERLTFEKQFRIPLKEEIDLQFFPEGGRLVNKLESKVAFKAIGTDGLSREVKGVIKDVAGEVVTRFESSHKGMGAFSFTPETKKEYFAFAEYNHRQFKFPLPIALEEGIVMAVSNSGKDSIPILTVKYSPSKANTLKYFVGSTYGKIRFTSPFKTTEDSCRIRIPLEILPEGISRLTILDSDFKPECERLIYVDRNQRFKIEVKPDSSSYGARSKVTLSVKTSGLEGEAVPANLSLSVVDKEQIIKDGSTGGISGYKLLESELKGTIEDVGFYFKNDSLINHEALDLLLLTQGYRRFFGGKVETHGSASLKYLPERSFEVRGKLALRGNSQRDKNFNYSDLGLTLLCPTDNAYFDQSKPDSLGKFNFQIPLQFGKPLILLRATSANGKAFKGNIPKGRPFRGDILLDEVAVPPLFTPPLTSTINIASPAIDYIRQLQEAKKTEISKITNGIKWHLNLPEVTITAKSKDKDWYTRFEDEAKKIVDMDSLDPTGKKYGNLYDLLVRDFGARRCRYEDAATETVILPCVSFGPSKYYPIYVLNGQTYCNAGEDSFKFVSLLRDLTSIRVNEIKTLMVLPPGNIAYHYADSKVFFGDVTVKQIFGEPKIRPMGKYYPGIKQSMVVIETYSKKNFYRGDPDGIKTFVLDGLDSPRLFYSPRYEDPSKQNPIYDGRATLYWNPSLRTNEKGESKVVFYTGDRRTEMEVIVNGIELGNGFSGQGKAMINAYINK